MNRYSFQTVAGDDLVMAMAATDQAMAVFALTGKTLAFRAMRPGCSCRSTPDAVLEKAGAIVSAAAGTFTVTLAPADTADLDAGDYPFLVYATSSGAQRTVACGRLRIIQGIDA